MGSEGLFEAWSPAARVAAAASRRSHPHHDWSDPLAGRSPDLSDPLAGQPHDWSDPLKIGRSHRLVPGDHVSFVEDPEVLLRTHGTVMANHPTNGVTIQRAKGAAVTFPHSHVAMRTVRRLPHWGFSKPAGSFRVRTA